ncbi:MAG: hypothetical protein HXX14_07105 [Bacteroidetes bacterium]|nr:hypothetical protein [Bacteroidota bacterium]
MKTGKYKIILGNSFIIPIFVSLFLWSCSTKHVEVAHKPVLTLLSSQTTSENDTMRSSLCRMEIGIEDTRKEQLVFELTITNNSTDTLQIDPSLFYYIPVFHDIDTISDQNPCLVKCIDPEKTINQLYKQRDSLSKMVNPYSLTHKKTGALLRDALITGTIAFLLKQKPEDLEEMRKNNEDDWYTDHYYHIQNINNQLEFWQNKTLRPMKLLPNTKVKGMVLFPIEKDAFEIIIKLPNKLNIQTFRFQQDIL